MTRVFGEIAGIPVGTTFASRAALRESGVHPPPMAGISGGEDEGAESIVVSGGYEDDEDYGDYIVYTGQGGNDPRTGRQIADQGLIRGNRSLATSSLRGEPVRVIRGAGGDPTYSPSSGFRYDGLYYVESYWSELGKSGFRVFRFKLVQAPEGSAITSLPEGEAGGPSPRIETSIQRIVRNTQVVLRVKALYDHTCQVCGVRVVTPAGPYAEGAHIRPLGRPHDGSDDESNVLCLCPTDHVRFDYGAFWIGGDLSIVDTTSGKRVGDLTTASRHRINPANLQYHRDRTTAQIPKAGSESP